MDYPCQLFFYVKTALKQPPPAQTLKTVIFNVGSVPDNTKAAAAPKLLTADVSKALETRGELDWLVDVHVSYCPLPGADLAAAIAYMDDPRFTFKKGALTLSVHSITLATEKMGDVPPPLWCERT